MNQLKGSFCQPGNWDEYSNFLRRLVVVRLQENGWYEPCKSRDLCTVLWAAGGEIPPADPACAK